MCLPILLCGLLVFLTIHLSTGHGSLALLVAAPDSSLSKESAVHQILVVPVTPAHTDLGHPGKQRIWLLLSLKSSKLPGKTPRAQLDLCALISDDWLSVACSGTVTGNHNAHMLHPTA